MIHRMAMQWRAFMSMLHAEYKYFINQLQPAILNISSVLFENVSELFCSLTRITYWYDSYHFSGIVPEMEDSLAVITLCAVIIRVYWSTRARTRLCVWELVGIYQIKIRLTNCFSRSISHLVILRSEVASLGDWHRVNYCRQGGESDLSKPDRGEDHFVWNKRWVETWVVDARR